jgi:hypothetical protein
MNGMGVEIGQVDVATTSGVGHSPEYYAQRICDKLISISALAPPEIRLQAEAYRDAIQALILSGIRGAIASDHTTLYNQLIKAGMDEAAALILGR